MTTPMFLQPLQNRVPLYKVATPPNATSTAGPSGTKRPRSPSPPTTQSPTHCYLPYNSYKSSPTFQHPQTKQPQQPVAVSAAATPTQNEDGRRNHEYARAVLWNSKFWGIFNYWLKPIMNETMKLGRKMPGIWKLKILGERSEMLEKFLSARKQHWKLFWFRCKFFFIAHLGKKTMTVFLETAAEIHNFLIRISQIYGFFLFSFGFKKFLAIF